MPGKLADNFTWGSSLNLGREKGHQWKNEPSIYDGSNSNITSIIILRLDYFLQLGNGKRSRCYQELSDFFL